jgi:spermidine/putrescine transport system ATP-binding protein
VTRSVYLGNAVRVIMRLATGESIVALVANTGEDTAQSWNPGSEVMCHLPPTAMLVLPVRTSAPAVTEPVAVI